MCQAVVIETEISLNYFTSRHEKPHIVQVKKDSVQGAERLLNNLIVCDQFLVQIHLIILMLNDHKIISKVDGFY